MSGDLPRGDPDTVELRIDGRVRITGEYDVESSRRGGEKRRAEAADGGRSR